MIAPTTYTPGFMVTVLIHSFTAATRGGFDSLGGAVVVVALLVRPSGRFGSKRVERA